ncbi:MAG: hypothetical protein LC798_11085 [Chloroflexi bacterium]|nr:hypothetical protein [Chloroflexota bacterium]
MSFVDPLGKLLTEIRDNAQVAAITNRIRGGEPAQGDLPPFVLIRLFPVRHTNPHLPLLRHQYMILCYGTTPKQATALGYAVGDAVHNLVPRQNVTGTAIYQSLMEVAGQAQTDPDTTWPFTTVIPSVIASTETVPA